MKQGKAFLTTGASAERLVTVEPSQTFYSTQYDGTDEEVQALLDFSEKVKAFHRWCREAKQAKATNGVLLPLPEFIRPEKPKPTRSKRAATKRSEEPDSEGGES
jgi:hypothetical protein